MLQSKTPELETQTLGCKAPLKRHGCKGLMAFQPCCQHDSSDGLLVHQFGPDRNISIPTGSITMKPDTNGQRMSPNDSGDHLTFALAPPSG